MCGRKSEFLVGWKDECLAEETEQNPKIWEYLDWNNHEYKKNYHQMMPSN